MFSKRFLLLLAAALWTTGCAGVKRSVQPTPEGTTPALGQAEPAPTPSGEPTPSVPAVIKSSGKTLTMAFVGDIMMGGSSSYKLKTEGPDTFFAKTSPFLKQADIVTGNLEGPLGLTGKKVKRKKYTFLVDPSCAPGLAKAGFHLLTLANNHIMDYGAEALTSTFAALEEAKLKHAGAGGNEAEAREPAWFEIKGRKVAVLAYSLTEPTQYWAGEKRPGCAAASGPDMREDIQKAKDKGAQLVFVTCHWGQEKKTVLRYYQPTLAHLAIDAGADGVIGHHPHIWQSLEVYKGKPIAYAIGNFAFGTLTSIKDSGILYLTYDDKGQWVGGKILPLNVYNYQVQFCPEPMKDKASVGFFNYLKKLSKTAELSLEGTVIDWKAPPPPSDPTSKPAVSNPTAVPTENAEEAENPSGSLPGIEKP